ncbi:MAG: hypothetical protein WCP01_10680 [Methylococcaceae bacterium]|jgi:hypothetical protein
MNKKYLSLKSSKTTKIGLRSEGFIHYRVLSDQDQKLYFNITANDDDGYYSKETIPFENIEELIKGTKPNTSISSSVFKKAFVGRSNNNAAFLAAILRAEKLLAPMTDAVKKHTVEAGWDRWKTDMLKNVTKAKPFLPEVVKASKAKKIPKKTTDVIDIESDIEPTELDDSDFKLLQPK